MAHGESKRLMTWEAAELAFVERMKAFRDEVFELFLQPTPPDIRPGRPDYEALIAVRYKDDCLRAFARVWVRKVKRGLRLIEKGVLKQTRRRAYGPVMTRNKADKPKPVSEEEKKRQKQAKEAIKKRAKEAKKKQRAKVAKKAPYDLRKKRKPGRPVEFKGAHREGHHAYIVTRWGGRLRVY